MDLNELNNEFTTLFEDLATNGSKGLDSYERSICLTYAQRSIIRSLAMSGNLVSIQNLVKHNQDQIFTPSIYRNGYRFSALSDPLVVIDYLLKGTGEDISAQIVPDQVIQGMLRSAYKYPAKNLAYVVVGEESDIVFPPRFFTMHSLVTRYIENPTPVILENLSGGLTIDGLNQATEPVLRDSFKSDLVIGAVKFAVDTYIGQEEKEVQ